MLWAAWPRHRDAECRSIGIGAVMNTEVPDGEQPFSGLDDAPVEATVLRRAELVTLLVTPEEH